MIEVGMTGDLKLVIPEDLSEITVEQYCEFLQGADEFVRWQNQGVEDEKQVYDSAYQLERLRRMMNMVADFSATSANPVPASELFRLPAGDFEQSLRRSFGIDSVDDFDFEASEATLYNIWAIIYRVISNTKFRPDTVDGFSFPWKGDTYHIKRMNQDRFTGLTLPPDITVQEAVEVLELRKKSDMLLQAGKHESKNLKWELLHRQLAILALKQGEELPTDDLEMEKFVSARAAHFIGIDALTAIQADFFLAGRLGLLKATLTAISFSIPPDHRTWKTQKTGANLKRKTKPLRKEWVTDGYTSD